MTSWQGTFPPLVVVECGELQLIARWRTAVWRNNLTKIVGCVGGMTGTAPRPDDEEPSATPVRSVQSNRHGSDRIPVDARYSLKGLGVKFVDQLIHLHLRKW